jgi:hypothetical protein
MPKKRSRSVDLKAIWATFTAHAIPHLHVKSPPPPTRPSSSLVRPQSKHDTGVSAAGTAFALTKDAADAMSQVPYVKAIAGVLSQIVQIREVRSVGAN